eukprot:g13016.t1
MNDLIQNPLNDIKILDENGTKKNNKKNKRSRRRNKPSTEDVKIAVEKQLRCWNVFGYGGLGLFLLLIAVASFEIYVMIRYSRTANIGLFARIGRPGVWVFLVISILFLIMILWFLFRWKAIANNYLDRNYSNSNSLRQRTKSLRNLYSQNISINGRFYLWKMYLYEFLENWIQFFNLRSVFLCSLPFEITLIVSFVMVLESILRLYIVGKSLWFVKTQVIRVESRNAQIVADIVSDLFFLIFPLAMIFLRYRILLLPSQTIWIILTPSISLFGKLRFMLVQTFHVNVDNMIISRQTAESFNLGRRRQSLFSADRKSKIASEQTKYFPRCAKLAVFTSTLIYLIVILLTMIIQAANMSGVSDICNTLLDGNSDELYGKGCVVKTPYCKDIFTPNCDCASISLNQHNFTELPERFAEMTNIQRLSILRGPLKRVPTNMERLLKLTYIDMSFNKIRNFSVNISKFQFLSKLTLEFNEIKAIDESVWKHETLTGLQINSNRHLEITEDIHLPNVFYLDVRNNSVLIPSTLGKIQLPSILFLYLNGNTFHGNVFPTQFETLHTVLRGIGVAQCKLKNFPTYLDTFTLIRYIDARDNNISSIPKNIENWFESKGESLELYLSGNENVCKTNEKYCPKICSKYCWKENSKDGFCDTSCNSKECEYDGGDCA